MCGKLEASAAHGANVMKSGNKQTHDVSFMKIAEEYLSKTYAALNVKVAGVIGTGDSETFTCRVLLVIEQTPVEKESTSISSAIDLAVNEYLQAKAHDRLREKKADELYCATVAGASYQKVVGAYLYHVAILFGMQPTEGYGTTIEMAVDTAIQYYETIHQHSNQA